MDKYGRYQFNRSVKIAIKAKEEADRERYHPDLTKLRMVRIDANTLVFSKEFALSDEQIRENWLKKHKLYNPKNL